MNMSTVSYAGRTEAENIPCLMLWSYDRWKTKHHNKVNTSLQINDKNKCLISSFKKKICGKAFNKRINEVGVNTKMHKITRTITYLIIIKQFWLAENECIFHVTLVQRRQVTNSPLSFCLCLNVLWRFFHLNYGLVQFYCLWKLTRAYSHQIALEIMFTYTN